MNGAAYEKLEAFGIPNGDLSAWAPTLPDQIKADFKPTLDLLRDANFQQALKDATQRERQFLIAIAQSDTVSSEVLFRVGDKELRPRRLSGNLFAVGQRQSRPSGRHRDFAKAPARLESR